MSIEFVSYRELTKTIKLMIIFIGISILGLLSFTITYLLHTYQIIHRNQETEIITSYKKSKSLSFPAGIFLGGPLSLKKDKMQIPMPNLSDEIVLLGKNDRPDASKVLLKVLLGIKSSGQVEEFNIGDKAFLEFSKEEGDLLVFKKNRTPFSIMPIYDQNRVQIFSELKIPKENSDSYVEENAKFTIHKMASHLPDTILSEQLKSLKALKVFGKDQLMKLYGGNSYKRLADSYRVVLDQPQGKQLHYVNEKDCFVYKDNQWIYCEKLTQCESYPLAQILSFNEESIKLKIWDVSGYHHKVVDIPITPQTPFTFSIDQVFGRIRQRTLCSLSCRIGNKSTILKKGDWLLHTNSGWRILRSNKEIHDYLNYKVEGELFVFDGIEKEKGSSFLLGHLFDRTRTNVQQVKVPFIEKKEKKQKDKQLDEFDDEFMDEFDEDLDIFDEIY